MAASKLFVAGCRQLAAVLAGQSSGFPVFSFPQFSEVITMSKLPKLYQTQRDSSCSVLEWDVLTWLCLNFPTIPKQLDFQPYPNTCPTFSMEEGPRHWEMKMLPTFLLGSLMAATQRVSQNKYLVVCGRQMSDHDWQCSRIRCCVMGQLSFIGSQHISKSNETNDL